MFRKLSESARANPFAMGLAGLGICLLLFILFVVFQRDLSGPWRPGRPGASSGPQAKGNPNPSAPTYESWLKRIGQAAPADFPAMMAEVMNIRDAALQAKVASALVAKWVNSDLTGFIAFVDASEVDDDGNADALWALLAPALASALPNLSDEVASRPELNEVVRRLIEYSARKDPDQALAWAKQWLLDDALESALATIAGEMIKKSPEQALAILQEIKASVRRVDAIGEIAAVYGAAHPKEATAWAKALPVSAERPYAMNAVLAARAETEPAAAATEFLDFRGKMESAYAVERAAEIARMGVRDIPERPNGEPLNPEEAMDSETLPGKEDPQIALLDEAAMAIAENWAATDAAQAMQWSRALPAGRLRTDAVNSAYAGWASQQPEAAYNDYIKNNASDAAPAEPIFEAWAQADPAYAAQRSNELTDPALREKAISGVVSGWLEAGSDQSALETWVDQLPRKQEQDLANAQIAEAASYDDPGTAWQRAMVIQNQGTRREALKSAFASLVEDDPAQARVMLEQAKNLAPAEVARLNKMLQAVTSKASN